MGGNYGNLWIRSRCLGQGAAADCEATNAVLQEVSPGRVVAKHCAMNVFYLSLLESVSLDRFASCAVWIMYVTDAGVRTSMSPNQTTDPGHPGLPQKIPRPGTRPNRLCTRNTRGTLEARSMHDDGTRVILGR